MPGTQGEDSVNAAPKPQTTATAATHGNIAAGGRASARARCVLTDEHNGTEWASRGQMTRRDFTRLISQIDVSGQCPSRRPYAQSWRRALRWFGRYMST